MDGTGSRMIGLFAAAAALLITSYVAALDAGQRAPALSGTALSGGSIDLAQHRGSVVVVDFWASWCEPCAEAMPALERIYQRYRSQGLVVIGVSQDRQASNARTFLERTRVSFPVMHDADHSVAGRYRPPTMPSSYVIDRQGVVRHVHSGFRSGDARRLEAQIRELL